MMKKTIAILGDTGNLSPVLMEGLMMQDLRLLFISEDETKHIEIKKQLEPLKGVAEIEFIGCEREGCWEADIIAIPRPENIPPALVEKIKEVATQKTVLIISEEPERSGPAELVKLLPHSRVIEIQFDTPARKFSIEGKDQDSLADIITIFENAGFKNE